VSKNYPIILTTKSKNFISKLRILRLIFFQFLLFSSFLSKAQDYRPLSQYTPQTWTSDEGLPNVGVRDVIQAKDGFIWVGTFGGIARFDGVNFEKYEDIFDKSELIFEAIALGANNLIWLGTDNGLFYFKENSFKKIAGDINFSAWVTSILVENQEKIWIGTRENGLYSKTLIKIYLFIL